MLATDSILSSLTISKPENLARETKGGRGGGVGSGKLLFPRQCFPFLEPLFLPTSQFYFYTSNPTYYRVSSPAYIPVPMNIP